MSNEIAEALNKEQSLVSHHLKALKKCSIVMTKQEAQKIYYRLVDYRVAELVLRIESLLKELPLCQLEGGCHEGRQNQGCCES